ncbi:uncharacterized protein [Chelonus insularis]|uniref:uncharacterized protein n=1 Tax=Chelonus insularis TaxID=460826 RepID=UPI00158C7061|nr:uncharacterized protein LOC118068309 [Chelonus insularis]
MELKLPEQVHHQVCRLCGQFESIYIDIFGEEGTKRLLGLKIHHKINILIDETDPLPKTICVQCLGKLEFVCDFQEECLRTQRLLRDQYDLPPLPDVDEENSREILKDEESSLLAPPPSTSTNNNNTSTDKNRNSTADIENVDPSQDENIKDIIENPENTKPKRSTRISPQNRAKNSDKDVINEHEVQETPNRRWLRSRNTTESRSKVEKTPKSKNSTLVTNKITSTSSPKANEVSIVTRLRSQNQNQSRTVVNSEVDKNSDSVQDKDEEKKRMIQIPTSALNKVLTAVSSSPDVEVSVKESKNRNGDIEDISFTLELRKKQESESVVTVLAKVFPDQGSCLVGSEIIDLLEDDNNSELNKLITSIAKGKGTKDKDSEAMRTVELEELEKKLSSISDSGGGDLDGVASRNPEELFRIDGEEIRVDDNVECATVGGQSGYACKLCRKFYERRDKCTVHVKTHLGIKQYACTLCSAKFVCKSDVMKHIRCSHTNPRPMQCPKCPKRFRSKFDLTEHDNVHKGVKPYQCSDCGQSYHHKVSLQMHVKSHLPPQNLACEYCGKVFPFRTRLLSHIGSVHLKNRRNFRCRFCYNLYSSLSVLNEHIKTRHATTYTCEICSKTFKVASKYKAHVLQHSNPKPFVCNICNNRYASKAFLNEHLLKHEGLRKHVCQKCGASFAQASHLAAHRHVHGEKTHACPECGRKFNRRDNMKVHRKRHFAESGRIVTTDKTQPGAPDSSVPASPDTTDSNEKIQEDDDLSHIICMRCCGTLEFLCDFYEQCHHTQEVLKEKNEELQKSSPTADESSNFTEENPNKDDDSNKENVIPSNEAVDNSRSSLDHSDPLNILTSSPKLAVDENDNPSENQVSESAPRRSHENVLVDITDQHRERHKTPISRGLFSTATTSTPATTKGFKRTRKSPPGMRKIRKIEQKKLTDIFKAQNVKNEKNNTIEDKRENEDIAKKLEVPATTKPEKELTEFSCREETNELIESQEGLTKSNKNSTPLTTEGDEGEESFTLHLSISSLSPSVPVPSKDEARKSVDKSPNCLVKDELNNDNNSKSNAKRRKSSSYGKISDLISQEQKEAIEKYYILDMSVVNEDTVKKNYYINEKKQIICKVCNATYPRVDKCHVHIWGHLEMKPYRCTACDFATVTVTNIRCHIRKSHLKIKPFECNLCNKRFVTAVLLEEHMNTHTGARPYQCKDCSFSSASRQVLTYHITTHKTVKDITCDICQKKFYSKTRMRSHMITHNKDKALMCKYCSHHFTSSEALQRHCDKIHSKDYVCETCGKRTKSRKALHNHYNVHSEAKYKCPICPNVYKSSHILKEHLLKHEGIRKYKCDVCNKDFAQQSHLAAHKAVHSEKRYFCPGCQRGFNRHDNMKMHTKRCESFLTNPELKSLLSQRRNSKSTSSNEGDPEDIDNSNNSFNNKSNKTEDFHDKIQKGSFRIGEVDIVPISNVQTPVNISTHNKVTVTESVIGLECY